MNHAQQRAAERYGLDLSQDDLSAIRLAIGQGRAVLLKRDGTKETYAVEAKGKCLRVVISVDGMIITVLPLGSDKRFLVRIDRTYRGNVRRKPEPRRTRGTQHGDE